MSKITIKSEKINSVSSIPSGSLGIFFNRPIHNSLFTKDSNGNIKQVNYQEEAKYFVKTIVNEDTNVYQHCGNIYLPGGNLSSGSSAFFGSYNGLGTSTVNLIDENSNITAVWTVNGQPQSSLLGSNLNINEGWYSIRIKNTLGISIFKSLVFIYI